MDNSKKYYEVEASNGQEAIQKIIKKYKLTSDSFDVEFVDQKVEGFLFKKNVGLYRVYVSENPSVRGSEEEDDFSEENNLPFDSEVFLQNKEKSADLIESKEDLFPQELLEVFVSEVGDFVATIISQMGYDIEVSFKEYHSRAICFHLESSDPQILIGRKGKNLDALQLLTNAYFSRLLEKHQVKSPVRINLDMQNYKERLEKRLQNEAIEIARKVRRSKKSFLLEPMKPFERRIIHKTLHSFSDIETSSEGEGHIKRVRVIFIKSE